MVPKKLKQEKGMLCFIFDNNFYRGKKNEHINDLVRMTFVQLQSVTETYEIKDNYFVTDNDNVCQLICNRNT